MDVRFIKSKIFGMILLLVVGIGLAAGLWLRGQSQARFDPVRWRQAGLAHNDNTRHVMMKDLLARQPLIGLTKQEVLDLLGPQSDPAYFKDYDLRYCLGPEPNPYSGIDSVWLVIKLKDGRVAEHQVVTD